MRQKHETGNRDHKRIGDHQAPHRGQIAAIAKASAKAVIACADGKLAWASVAAKGAKLKALAWPPTNGRPRPAVHFTNSPTTSGTDTAKQHELQTQTDRKQPSLRRARHGRRYQRNRKQQDGQQQQHVIVLAKVSQNTNRPKARGTAGRHQRDFPRVKPDHQYRNQNGGYSEH